MKIPLTLLLVSIACRSLSSGAETYAGWSVGLPRDGQATILHTIDSGNVWVPQGSGQVAAVMLYGVFADSPTSAWVVGDADAGYATIYRTTDGGATWLRKGFGQPALHGIGLGKVHSSSNHVWAVGRDAILLSTDHGATWTNCLPVAFTNRLLQGLFSLDGITAWVGGEGAAATGTATVLKTANAGQSWTLLDGGDIGLADHILGISAIDAQTVWAVGGSDFLVFRSDDGGVTWAKQPATGGLGDANEIYAVDHFTVYAAIDNYIEWTTNGGPSWATHTSYPYTMGVCAVSPDEAWACVFDAIYSTGSIWHTSNGGQTWDDQLVPNGPIRSLWNISFAREPIPEPAVCSLLFCLAIAACTRLRLGRG